MVRLGAEKFSEFLSEMWLGVHDGAFLHEFPGGSIVLTSEGTERGGPWPPDECSRCLLNWFDRGWIDAYVLREQLFRWPQDADALPSDPANDTARILEVKRARAILSDPRAWTNDSPEGFVVLNPTNRAPGRQLWLDAVRPFE